MQRRLNFLMLMHLTQCNTVTTFTTTLSVYLHNILEKKVIMLPLEKTDISQNTKPKTDLHTFSYVLVNTLFQSHLSCW